MTVRIHPPDDPSAFADRLLALLPRSARARAAAGSANSADSFSESEPAGSHCDGGEVSPP